MNNFSAKNLHTRPGRHQCLEFKQKADRYALALRGSPWARLFELIPILYLLPSQKEVLLDLFAGTGFVSHFLSTLFSKTILIDEVESLIGSQQDPSIVVRGDALDPSVLSEVGNNVDMAVCFAGLHHALAKKNGELDVPLTEELRISALNEWRSILNEDGCLLVVDVPAPGELAGSGIASTIDSVSEVEIPDEYVAQIKHILDMTGVEDLFAVTSSDKLDVYLDNLQQNMTGIDFREPDPAMFFESFVSNNSQVGHEAYFQSVAELTECFQKAGFADIRSFVAPTPWFFKNRVEALWFINELFAISDDSYDRPGQLSEQDMTILDTAVDRYLGCSDLPGGGCVIWWKLMYVRGSV